MRILLDSCISGGVAQALRNTGNDVEYAGDWPEDPGDEEILSYAWWIKQSTMLAMSPAVVRFF